MLIEATVGNLFSFGDPQTLSMVADDDITEKAHYVMEAETTPPLKLLRWAALLGANASGKSNFLKALSVLDRMVGLSKRQNEGDELSDTFKDLHYLPFNFSDDMRKQPSLIEVVFVANHHLYKFAVTFTNKKVESESLYLLDNDEETLIYDRTQLNENFFDQHDVLVKKAHASTFSGQLTLSRMLTNLDKAYDYTHLKNVANWFGELVSFNIEVPFTRNIPTELPALGLLHQAQDNPELKTTILDYLNTIDIGIVDFELPSKEGGSIADIKFYYKDKASPALPIYNQSMGTIKALSLFEYIRQIEPNNLLLIDELDMQLHPMLFKTFINDVCLKRNIQLVFTCHSPYVLDEDGLDPRLDQIWRVEKDRSTLMSELASVSDFDFSGLPSRKFDLKLAYLDGRFGGIPRIKGF
jgi:AAA15 family ATPase/GTPase